MGKYFIFALLNAGKIIRWAEKETSKTGSGNRRKLKMRVLRKSKEII